MMSVIRTQYTIVVHLGLVNNKQDNLNVSVSMVYLLVTELLIDAKAERQYITTIVTERKKECMEV